MEVVPCPFLSHLLHRLNTGDLRQQVDMWEATGSHSSSLTQLTRVAAGTQQCSCQRRRPQYMPRGLWAQLPARLKRAPSPGETDPQAGPSTCSLGLSFHSHPQPSARCCPASIRRLRLHGCLPTRPRPADLPHSHRCQRLMSSSQIAGEPAPTVEC
jgi:hypothetical protein